MDIVNPKTDQPAPSPEPIRLPSNAVALEVLAAIGGDAEAFGRYLSDDELEGTEKAPQYLAAVFSRFEEYPSAIAAAIGCAQRLQGAPRDDLITTCACADIPACLREPGRLAALPDETLRLLAINNAFVAELDRLQGRQVHAYIWLRGPDDTVNAKRIDVRDFAP